MKTYTDWLPEHIEFLRNNYDKLTNQELAEAVGKTKKAVTHKLSELGLKRTDKRLQIGDIFGNLEVISQSFMRPVGQSKQSYVKCKCQCETIEIIRVQELKKNRRQCLKCGKKTYNRSPEQRLTPTGREEMRKTTRYAEYECECDKKLVWVHKQAYLDNKTKSCGCLNQEKRKARTGKNNGNFSHGLSEHPLHLIWHGIKSRCTNQNIDGYHGGNIKICDEWEDFIKFYNWAIGNGWESGLCISRQNYELDYCPDNCYITTAEEISNKPEIKEKVYEASKQAIKDKYNVEHLRYIPGVDEKIRKKCNELYGGDSPLCSKVIQNKITQTNIDNHGVSIVPFEVYKDKTLATNRARYGYDYPVQHPDIIKRQTETRMKRGLIYIHDGLKAAEWAEKVGIAASTMRARIKELGFEEAILIPKRQSTIEYKMEKFLQSLNIEHEMQKRIEDKYADFVLNNFNLIIEVDGLYWHSDAINADRKYHIKKKRIYKNNGYDTMFFREDEINNKFEIVSSIIMNRLSLNVTKIMARKTKIVELNSKESVGFFLANHLMGRGSGKTYALIYNDDVVSAIRINDKKNGLEISRFCNKLNTSVIGGYSKLIKHIERTYKPEVIKTFVDLRYGSGDYLNELGFTKEKQHLSFRWVRDDMTFSRQKYTGNTGYDNRCFKIWDCGQALWQKKTRIFRGF